MPDSFASLFDRIVWDRSSSGARVDVGEARASAITANGGHGVQLTFETVFIADGHPFDVIHPNGMLNVERRVHGDVEVLLVDDAEGRWVLVAMSTVHDGVFHLVSGLPATHSRSKKVERWVARSRDLSRCYLNHDDFTAVGDRLSEWGDVEVVKVAARVAADASSMNRGFPAVMGGLRPSHRQALTEIEDHGASVRTLRLHVEGVLDVHLRRVAGATLYSGQFSLFREQVLQRLENATAQRRALLTGRQRRTLTAAVRPLTVTLPHALMTSREATGTVLEEVRAMPNVSMAVFHRNPYLHFVVTDEIDGSNFDVMVTREDAIDVYPGYRATPAALARITQQLSERFGALDVGERPEQQKVVSLHDLVSG